MKTTEKEIKPVWYFAWQSRPRMFRFYLGKTEGIPNGKKHWCLNVGLYFIDFGRAY